MPRNINNSKAQIVAVVGPKGGVGKTTIAANLGISLSRLGKKVVVVDLDLGAANLNSFLGIRNSKYSLDDFILNKVDKLQDIVLETGFENMEIICGGNFPEIANLHYSKKMKLIRNLSMLECDNIILDLGAGTSYNVVDFVIIAKDSLLLTTPEVPSIINTYGFLKTLVFRRLTFAFKQLKNYKLLDLLSEAKDVDKNPHLKKMDNLIKAAGLIDENASRLVLKILPQLKPTLILNRIHSEKDLKACTAIQNLMKEYLGIECNTVFSVHEDASVGYAAARMKPVMLENPGSVFAKDITKIAKTLAKQF